MIDFSIISRFDIETNLEFFGDHIVMEFFDTGHN